MRGGSNGVLRDAVRLSGPVVNHRQRFCVCVRVCGLTHSSLFVSGWRWKKGMEVSAEDLELPRRPVGSGIRDRDGDLRPNHVKSALSRSTTGTRISCALHPGLGPSGCPASGRHTAGDFEMHGSWFVTARMCGGEQTLPAESCDQIAATAFVLPDSPRGLLRRDVGIELLSSSRSLNRGKDFRIRD